MTAPGTTLDDAPPPPPVRTPDRTVDRTVAGVAAALSASAGLVHVGVASEHVAHHWTMGAAFLLTGWAQLGTAAALWRGPPGRCCC